LAHVLTSKYGDHLPLHRQEAIFQRHRITIHRSTLCDWVGECATRLEPLVKEMHRQILLSEKIHTDDTPVTARHGSGPGVHKGYLWTYIDAVQNVVFDYTPGPSREGPLRFLGDYGGYVQADAYNGYDVLFAQGRATEGVVGPTPGGSSSTPKTVIRPVPPRCWCGLAASMRSRPEPRRSIWSGIPSRPPARRRADRS
jgi:transposase